jgi:peptidylprolyl isomerase
MSNQVHSRGSTSGRRMTKAEKRTAAKAAKAAAAAKAAKARRRRQVLTYAAAGLAVVGVIIAAFLVFGRSPAKNNTAAAQPSATPAATATSSPAFPPLPPGANPALAKKPTTSAGTGQLTALKVTTLIQGTGAAAKAGQNITVNYVGVSYKTGAEFDASWNRSQPFSFQLGAGNVIKGWDQGLVGVKVGSRVQLDIPSALAYGDNPSGGQPAGPLRFIVDVLALQ